MSKEKLTTPEGILDWVEREPLGPHWREAADKETAIYLAGCVKLRQEIERTSARRFNFIDDSDLAFEVLWAVRRAYGWESDEDARDALFKGKKP